jgi:uncharacterized protein YkvS
MKKLIADFQTLNMNRFKIMGKSAEQIVEFASTFTGVVRQVIETRVIVLALGIESHQEDLERNARYVKQHPKLYSLSRWKYLVPAFQFLREKFEEKFEIEDKPVKIRKILNEHNLDALQSVRRVGTYTSDKQKVKYVIVTTVSKKDFKQALETAGPPHLIVIYSGHSRYGRGACFHTYTGEAVLHQKGDHWEGTVGIGTFTGDNSGLFRLGYPYILVPLEDIEHHHYHFIPVPVESGAPPRKYRHPFSRHPEVRKSLKKITLPFEFWSLVWPPTHESSTHRYFGRIKRELEDGQWKNKVYIILREGWQKTINDPYDLGATNIKCRAFCHLGCSSSTHFWDIVRKKEYKGWERPKPPEDKYAYFTRNPADARVSALWLYYLLSYNKENNFKPWWKSLEYAKKMTNKKLRSIRSSCRVF